MPGFFGKPGDGSVTFNPGDRVEILNVATGHWEVGIVKAKGKMGDDVAYQVEVGHRHFAVKEQWIRSHYASS